MTDTAAASVRESYAAKPRYEPPAHYQTVALHQLLEGTSRWRPNDRSQMVFLSRLDSSQTANAVSVFAAGDVSLVKRPCVSVIGTRKVSPEGAARARRAAKELAQRGVVVVSGLAEGVDSEAMMAAMASGGRTIGVIGTPLSRAYPAKNAALQEEVYRDHLLISQFAEGASTLRSSFPQRNKLMAFISNASIIIEASDTSGTLHQAAECQRLGRWLFIARSVAE
ncbi:MAG TPA: DNA-processing protein DprA, partial [Reyranella sp.]|nr:DNA-processing protein DprA [Reyranella sp.]